MTYYADLFPCPYFGKQNADKLIAIGWLDDEHDYNKGDISPDILGTLFHLLAQPWTPLALMGFEDCPICNIDIGSVTFNEMTVDVGNLNLFVPGKGFLYVMPSLAVHYIIEHSYAPPQEFCETVLACPPMGSQAYFRAISDNAPDRFAKLAKAKLTDTY